MSKKYQIIQGGSHQDDRGKVVFANEFDLSPVKRIYHIHHSNTEVVRAWQGHKIETKWFHCIKGSFEVKLAQITDWKTPSQSTEISSIHLIASNSQVLHIPGGYINGFRALENDSILMVFSDVNVKASVEDDYRIDKNYFGEYK